MADTFKINAMEFPYPEKFQMSKVPNIVCALRTMSGKDVADVNGWKYADTSISWSALEDTDIGHLAWMTSMPTFTITFLDPWDGTVTVNAINRGLSHSKTRFKNGGKFVFEDVTLDLSFPDCYPYS